MKHQLEEGMYCRPTAEEYAVIEQTVPKVFNEYIFSTLPEGCIVAYNNYGVGVGGYTERTKKEGNEIPTTEFINRLKGEHNQ